MKIHKKLFELLEILYKIDEHTNITKEIKKLKLSIQQQQRLLLYAQKKDFIEGSFNLKENQMAINITPLGMDAFYEYSERNSQKEFNKIIAFTGSILALVGIYNFIYNLVLKDAELSIFWLVSIIFLILTVICLGPLSAFVINYYIKWIIGNE